MDINRNSAHQSQNEDIFLIVSPGLEFLSKWSRKEKNNGKGHSASTLSRFASFLEGEVQQILTERHYGKNQTNDKLVCFNLQR